MATADERVDLHALLDLTTPWCLRIAVTLRVADHIANGVDQIEGLAAATACDPYALHRVLSHLASKGVFREVAPGRFALSAAAEQLSDASQFLDLEGIGGRMASAWETLPSYVRTGRPAYQEKFGRPFWEDLAAHPELKASFDDLMGPHGHGVPDQDIELEGGWERVSSVVDVGGGTGAFLAQLLRRHLTVLGTLVDLPATVARSATVFEEAGVADRGTAVGQSFFEVLPAGADLYILQKILNDWPDRETVAILRRCAEAASPAGRVVVLGGISPDDAPVELTIEMVLLGGRTNSMSEFRNIAHEAGLEVVAAPRRSDGPLVIECRPASN